MSIINTIDESNRTETERPPEVLTQQWVRNRTNDVITDALRRDDETLVESPPAAGKTTELFAAVEDVGEPISYLTQREDLYDQAGELARQEGLSAKVLPSPHRKCPTFKGDHGNDLKNRVRRLYGPGVSGSDIHEMMDLPCTDEGACPYQEAWDFEPAEYDVLVGHYVHANIPSVVENRTIVIDEFAEEAPVTHFSDPEPVVTDFLSRRPGLPFDDWSEFVENRKQRRAEAVNWFVRNYRDKNPDPWDVIADEGDVHGLAGDLVLGLLFAEDLGNGFRSTEKYVENPAGEKVLLRDTSTQRRISPKVAWNGENGDVHLLSVPNLDNANGVVGLDGTPTKRMWDTAFGVSFDHERVVPKERMNDYLTEALDIHVHQYGANNTNGKTRPYSSGNHLYPETDERLLFGVGMEFEDEPDVITTKAAIDKYDRDDRVLHRADDYRNFAQVKSSNVFRESTLGAVLGSPHPGDEVFKRWGAFMGQTIRRYGDDSPDDKGMNLDYGRIGNQLYRHYVHNQIAQSILRFGRDGQEAHVLVTSMCTPSWIEPEPLGVKRFNRSSRAVIDALMDTDGMTQGEIVDDTGLSQQAVSKVLNGLDEQGFVGIGGTDDNGNLRRTWEGV